MHCPQCQQQNSDTAKFCEACGTKLVNLCPQCGHQANSTAKFCAECGVGLTGRAKGKRTRKVASSQSSVARLQHPAPRIQPPASYTPPHLAERIRAGQAALEARGATDGERKTITALFADLKGSTALIEGLDPEEARAIIDPALHMMMEAVHHYEGYVAQALGDGIFALFGAPLAHEDHPQRALYAALRMQEEIQRYSDTLREKGYVPLLMRVGVNTGEVVVRSIRKEDLHTDYVPIGHSTNLAARMEQLAAPGSILVTEYTHKLTVGYFEFKSLGKTQVKGVEEPLPIYEVLGAGPLRTRLQVAARRGLTRFVGRHAELAQMQRALEQARAGHGQIVGVMSESGLGKSRLFYEFKLTLQRSGLVLEAYSASHGKASPYLPLIELLKGYFHLQSQDDECSRKQKVIDKVLELDRSLEDTLPYLLMLLSIDDPLSSLQQMDPQLRRRRTFAALKKLFLRESLNQPLILIFEDLHWIDSETQGFLDVLSESVASARILVLTNYRPEYRHEWGSKTYYTQLRLAPLGKEEAEELLAFLLGNDANLTALKHLILEKTEGTPFFMEEIVQDLVEQGVLVRNAGVGAALRGHPQEGTHIGVPLQRLHLPPTMQGVLAARIDRLAPDEKVLLQHLAVIGREFPLSLVRQVVPQPEEELYRFLSSLQRKEFLYEQPAFPEAKYLFKHALTQEVAYNSVLHQQRKALHERTGQAMEALYKPNLEEYYSALAHHYSRSGNTQKAIDYLHLAGQQAVQRSANADAITHLTSAIELLKTLPDTPERDQQELMLQVALGTPVMATKGWSAPEVERVYTRARELCQHGGDSSYFFPVLVRQWTYYATRSEWRVACEVAEQFSKLAQDLQGSEFFLVTHNALGIASFILGDIPSALEHNERGMALYDPQQHESLAFLYGWDEGSSCLLYASYALWYLGYADQALRKLREALRLSREHSHLYTLALTPGYAALHYQFRREARAVQEQAETAIALCQEHGFVYYLAWGTIMRGWALAEQGQAEEGIAQIRQGLADTRATGAEFVRSYFLALLAEAYGKAEQVEEGLAALAEALALVDKTGERFYEAELYRLKGTLTLQSQTSPEQVLDKSQTSQNTSEVTNPQSLTPNPQTEAETYFHKAIEIAQRQQAKSLELRAVTSLSRLWKQQGKHLEARQQLAEIYHWFTEGFDTADLRDAKALLEELS